MPVLRALRIGCLTRADLAQLRAMPRHPVHAAALDSLPRCSRGQILLATETKDPSSPPRGYLTYHSVNQFTVQLDYLYSPYSLLGIGTLLMDEFEAINEGKTAVLMTTVAAMSFYQRRGYTVNTAYMFSKDL